MLQIPDNMARCLARILQWALLMQADVGCAGAASTPVFGVLRKMTTANIANRLNWTAYRNLGVSPFQGPHSSAAPVGGAKRDSVVMGAPQATLDTFFKKKPRKQ